MGGVYAILALALVMIYQATHLVNFAQGEMAMFSTYIAWALVDAGMPYWAAFLAHDFAFLHRRHGDRTPDRAPLSHAPVLTMVIVFIGLLLIFNSVAGWLFSYDDQEFRQSVPGQAVVRQHVHVVA